MGILVTFAPEFGRAMGMREVPVAGQAIMFCYIGLSLGSLLSGTLSQVWRTRTKVVRVSMILNAVLVAVYFAAAGLSLRFFYAVCFALGIANGYWAVFVLMASELFGTNIRATAATTTPNFVRGSVVVVTLAFQSAAKFLGIQGGAVLVGALTLLLAFAALGRLEDTYGKDLDYVEQ